MRTFMYERCAPEIHIHVHVHIHIYGFATSQDSSQHAQMNTQRAASLLHCTRRKGGHKTRRKTPPALLPNYLTICSIAVDTTFKLSFAAEASETAGPCAAFIAST